MKTKVWKKILMTLTCTALTVALSACSGDKAGENSSQITIGIPQDIEDSLDPHDTLAAGTEEVLFNMYEGLVKPDSSGNLIDAVASSHSISDDGKVYTFTLRENVKFHDGSIVTVEDVKYSLDKCADTSNGAPLVAAYTAIDSINIVDDSTVEVVLKEADTDFLPYLTTAIIPASNEDPDNIPIGTGPYKFVSRSVQEEFVMEKFDEYWGTPANIELVTFKVIADSDLVVTNLNGGAIDMYARLPQSQLSQVSDEFNVLEGSMNLVQALYLNNADERFDDVKVRQALCYAVDKQALLDMLSDSMGTPIGSSMFPSFGKYYMEELNDLYPYDPEKAKSLLTEAGYPEGISFKISVPSNYAQHVSTAQILAEQFKASNIKAEIELIEWESWVSDVYSDRKFETTIVGLDASTLSASALLSRFVTGAGKNFVNFSDAAYDEAYANAVASTNDEEKTAYYKECEKILADQAANVYLQDMASLVILNKKYAGYEFYPLYIQDISKLYIVEAQ